MSSYIAIVIAMLSAINGYAQKSKHIFYIYGDSLARTELSATEGNCLPNNIYERIYLGKRKFIDIRHQFHHEDSEKKHTVFRDTFLLRKGKLYYNEGKIWNPYYIGYNAEGVIERDVWERLKHGRFRTVEYTEHEGKKLAIVIEYPLDDYEYRYYFDPKLGMIGVEGYAYMVFRAEPCPVNWLKLTHKEMLDMWILEYEE